MKSFAVITIGLMISLFFTDLKAENSWESFAAPLGVLFFALGLIF